MKVYISADIEGIAGIAHWDEADRNHAAWPQFRDRMTAHVAAACEGALAGGALERLRHPDLAEPTPYLGPVLPIRMSRADLAVAPAEPLGSSTRAVLKEWLALCDRTDSEGDGADAKRARLALLAVNTAASVRARAPKAQPAKTLLYAGGGY